MLPKSKQQAKKGHKKNSATDAKHSRGNPAGAGGRKDPQISCHPIRHGHSPRADGLPCLPELFFSKATVLRASGSSQTTLSGAGKPWGARSNYPRKHPPASPARIIGRLVNPPGPASSIRALRPTRLGAAG